jgi:hypothetical protein
VFSSVIFMKFSTRVLIDWANITSVPPLSVDHFYMNTKSGSVFNTGISIGLHSRM